MMVTHIYIYIYERVTGRKSGVWIGALMVMVSGVGVQTNLTLVIYVYLIYE